MFYRGPFYHDGNYRMLAPLAAVLPVLMAQAVWWAAILAGAALAAAALLVQIALTFWLDRNNLPSWRRLLLLTGSGLLLDALTVQLDLVAFRDAGALGLPLWLLLLWISFALTVPRLQQWLPRRASQLAVFVIAAPLAYFAGAALGAATVQQPLWYGITLVIGWSALTLLWQVRGDEPRAPVPLSHQQHLSP
ncbi:MAG TPA: DUF2878 family protein [Permianibacter sp.]|nr:DUF2878 family protein [Permianibacter sp.]